MLTLPTETEVLGKVISWAEARPDIRAVIITSSRVRPGGPVDLLSDYDIVLAVTDPEPFARDGAWINDYGRLMVVWGDQGQMYGQPTHFRGAIYSDYVKIDWGIWPVALLDRIAAEPRLPDELDVGYKVLLDKDGRTAGWQPPSYRAHIPAQPTEAEYLALVDEFWWIATYVAKSLWRDELAFARFCLDYDMRLGVARKMLEWRIEIDHDWTVKPGVLGRGLKKLLPPDTWQELEATYAGPNLAANWDSLFRLGALFRRVATEVGEALGYTYPLATDAEVNVFLNAVRELP
jgi:aminoglycoside 6-adenylyltransferase